MKLELNEGSIVGHDFRVVRPLAEGGMGAVYVVDQISTGKQRALKVMHARFAADPRSRERFTLEARASGRIASDHVVEVVAAGVDEASATPWMVMELLDGETLDAVLERRGGLPLGEACEVFSQLGHALAAAHAVGIVHRDLKPENVVLSAARRAGAPFTVKVLDFGIAKLLTEGAATNTMAIGSPRWMAPEQSTTGAAIAPPTDVWAFGLLAYTTLTGCAFWRNAQRDTSNAMALLIEVGAEPLPTASQRAAEQGHPNMLPQGFDAWFARCVARPIHERFANGGEATAALLPILQAQQPAGVRPSLPYAPTQGQPVFAQQTPTPPTQAAFVTGPTVLPTVAMPVTATPAAMSTTAMPASTGPVPWGMPPAPASFSAPVHGPPPRRTSPIVWVAVSGLALSLVGGVAGFVWYAIASAQSEPTSPPVVAPPIVAPPVVAPPVAAPPVAAPPVVAPPVVAPPVALQPLPSGPVMTPTEAPDEDEDVPFEAGQRWVGSYMCAQGRTRLVLRITSVTDKRVEALFDFAHSASGSNGVCRMHGTYVPASRRLPLRPGAWVRQPPGYIAVGMDGSVSADGSTYSGRMQHPACGAFSLRLAEE